MKHRQGIIEHLFQFIGIGGKEADYLFFESRTFRIHLVFFCLVCCRVDAEYLDKVLTELVKIDGDTKILQNIRNIGNHLAGVELIAFSCKGSDVTTDDRILFNNENLLPLKVAMQRIGKPGGEAVYPGPDDNQVFFVVIRDKFPLIKICLELNPTNEK